MTEPVLVCLSFRNDGEPEPMPCCITQVPMTERGGVWQHLDPDILAQFGDNLTLYWEAEWDGQEYYLIRPITAKDIEQMQSYRCPETTDMDL
jgi:hypothetical protein